VGGKILWTFGDTRFPFAAEDGQMSRASSGAYAEFDAPMVLNEPVDARGAPFQLLPFTAEELQHNQQSGPDERYALWPTAVIPKGENALILYTRLKVRLGGLEVERLSTGFAEVIPWQTTATRSGEVFVAPEPQFHHAAVLDAGDLYLYACGSDGACKVARAPFADATRRPAYEFWTGFGWSGDVGAAVASVPGGTSGFSVTYNTYLERFVSVASEPLGKITMRVSTRPEGPWGDEIAVFDAGAMIHATVQHYELFADAGRTMFISYYRPGPSLSGEVRLLEVRLK
jgi:hypothetical protein